MKNNKNGTKAELVTVPTAMDTVIAKKGKTSVMANRPLRIQNIKGNILRCVSAALLWIVEPSDTVEEKQRQRARLLSAYFLFLTITILVGVIVVQRTGNSAWVFMLVTAISFMIGYVLSRTRYYWPATMLAVTFPAFPALAALLFGTNQVDVEGTLMWLVLPLLISTLLLSLGYTIIIAISYIISITILALVVDIPLTSLGQSLGFLSAVTFFAITIAIIHQRDQSEIEQQLVDLKRAQEALRESEEKFSKAFSSSPAIISIVNVEDSKFIEVNDSFTRFTGLTREEVIGHTDDELNIWAKAEERDRIINRLKEKGRVSKEEMHTLTKSGEIRVGLFSAEIIHIGGEMCSITVIVDITELKRAQEALRESEEKFSKAFSASPDIISLVNLEDNRFIEANDSFTRFTGYTRDEVIGHITSELGIWAKAEERDRILGMLKEQGRVRNEEMHTRTKSGEIRVGLYSAETIHIGGALCTITVIVDITERKRAEQALRESEEKFSKAFRTSPGTVTITTFKDGKFLELNDTFTRWTGYSREELIGRRSIDIGFWVNPEDRNRILQIIKEQGRVNNEEFNVRMKSGEIRTWLFFMEPIDIGGESCILSATADITARKRAEEALRESEEKFSKAFRTSPNTMVITTLKDGKFIEVNDSHIRITGYTREEIIGRSSKDIDIWAKADDRARMLKILKEQGRVDNEEFDFRMKSGEIRTWLFSAEPINIGGEPCIISMTIDITELKRAQAALANEAIRRRILIEQSRDGIVVLDENGNVYESNQRFAEMLGYSLEEARQLHVWDWEFLFPREQVMEMIRSVDETGDHFETQHIRKDGTIYDVEISTNGAVFEGQKLVFCVCRDITKRKRAEEALRFSDAAFKSIHESVIALDIEDTITHWNDISEQMFSIKASEALGKKFPDVIQIVDSRPDKFEEVLKILETQGYYQEEQLYRTKKGNVWVDVHVQDIVSDGKRYGRVILASDISHRKKAEAKLKKALSNLEHSSAQLTATNKELEAFSYSVSHDLRSPLRSIDGFSQALLEDYQDQFDEEGQEYLRRLRGASQKMGELIDGILKLSRLSRSQMHKKKVNLSALVEEITARLHETQPERHAEFVISKGLSDRGDPELLRALFENLLSNAWKFTSKCKRARIEFGTTQNNGKKTYFINDNGAGFDMTYADKLFGAFQRLHEATEYPGTGIGLATVQRIINRHGGSIWAEGAVGKGATFYFTLN